MASARQFKKVGDIIRADKTRRFVIPSAPGKRNTPQLKKEAERWHKFQADVERTFLCRRYCNSHE